MFFLGTITVFASAETLNVEASVYEYQSNVNRSIELYEELVTRYRARTALHNGKEFTVYSDDFAGVYIDEKGLLNIAVVGEVQNDATLYGGFVLYKQFSFSYNYLQKIMNTVETIMDDYAILTVGIDDKYNHVFIELTDERYVERIIEILQLENLYNYDALKIIVDPNARNIDNANIAYGGDQIISHFHGEPTASSGTMSVNVICNITGQLGVLTNEHVARVTENTTTNNIYDSGWNLIGNFGMRGQNGGTIDAAFIPFANQIDWAMND